VRSIIEVLKMAVIRQKFAKIDGGDATVSPLQGDEDLELFTQGITRRSGFSPGLNISGLQPDFYQPTISMNPP
jgi:hypothetical protein